MSSFGTYLTSYRQRDRTQLKCAGPCFRRKPREEFRETPWHGRAARCLSCEGDKYRTGGRWKRELDARTHWELEQAREKLRMYQRYAATLRLQRMVASAPSSADAFRAHMRPWERVMEARRRKWAPLVEEALSKAHTQSEEEA
ncbi:hypothetical protein [Streptomyces sp. NPDC057557]|uniref:hypothetical protein n=1 Tax=Streptomyces sp. NPDC057557 TaxID=3346167 RepID=UPI0036B03749